MYFGRRILPVLAAVAEPVDLFHLHGALRPGGGCVVAKQRPKAFLQNVGIILGKTCFFRQLNIDGALDKIKAKADKMLHAHGVGRTLLTGSAVNTFSDLQGADFHRRNTDSLMDGYRASYANRYTFSLFFTAGESKYLSKASNVQPSVAGLL